MLSNGMRTFASLLFFLAVSVSACTAKTHYPDPTLSEKLGIELQLPIPEDEFIDMMNARSFAIERIGAGSRYGMVSRGSDIDLESMGVVHAYGINTGFNAPAGRMESYIAYVDANGEVIRVVGHFARVASLKGGAVWQSV